MLVACLPKIFNIKQSLTGKVSPYMEWFYPINLLMPRCMQQYKRNNFLINKKINNLKLFCYIFFLLFMLKHHNVFALMQFLEILWIYDVLQWLMYVITIRTSCVQFSVWLPGIWCFFMINVRDCNTNVLGSILSLITGYLIGLSLS